MRTWQSRIGQARPVVRRRFSPGLLLYYTTFCYFFFLSCVVVFLILRRIQTSVAALPLQRNAARYIGAKFSSAALTTRAKGS